MEFIPNYLMTTDNMGENIYETSYVYSPAVNRSFLKFNDTKPTEKRHNFAVMRNAMGMEQCTAGVWMMPNTKYLREYEGNFYTVEFTKEALKDALLKHLKSGMSNNTKWEHEGGTIDGFATLEYWIIESPETKSPIYGLSLADMGYSADEIPIGTVMKTTFCGDGAFWDEIIMGGYVKGYSIGGLFDLQKVDSLTGSTQSAENYTEQVKQIFGNKIDNAEITDTVKIGEELFDGTLQAKKDEMLFDIIVRKGYVVDYHEHKAVETPTEQKANNNNNEEFSAQLNEMKQMLQSFKDEINALKNEAEALKTEVLSKNEIIDGLNKEKNKIVEEFSKQPLPTNKQTLPIEEKKSGQTLRVGNRTIEI